MNRPSQNLFPRFFNRLARPLVPALLVLFSAVAARADATNVLSTADSEGRALAQKILAQRPSENYTNAGVLTIRSEKNGYVKIPVRFEVVVGDPWRTIYTTAMTNAAGGNRLAILHVEHKPDVYQVSNLNRPPGDTNEVRVLSKDELLQPFAGSDFSYADLGLKFFHWPQQTVLKKEFYHQCACVVLESTNPHPNPSNYSRVVCWIDEESLGIVKAYAYDARGQELKYFYPKSFEKVNGKYQLKSMVMENRQTDSKSVLEFELDQ
jgi:hypothetical protein